MTVSSHSSRKNNIVNALTFDVEDYFHVSALSGVIRPDEWEQYEVSE